MYKQLLSATAIALAFGLQGCGSLPTVPKVDTTNAFQPGAKGIVAEKVGLADAAAAAGDSTTAIRMYRELAREYPLSLEPRIKLGAALLAANAPQEAARAYEGANKLNPTYDGVSGLGRVYLALSQPAQALKEFDIAAQIKPGDAQAMNGQAVALDQLGRHVEAQKTYLAILDHDPSNLKVRSNYALSLALAGKYDDAADILNSLAQVPDSDDRIRQNLALVYGLAGNSGQAAHFGRMDLDEDAVNSNLKYYGAIRNLNSPADKSAALTRPSAAGPVPAETGPFDAVQANPSSPVASKQGGLQPQASAAPAKTADVPQIAARNIVPLKTHDAEKHAMGEAGMKPVIVARVEPANSSSPPQAKPPTEAELAQILAPAEAAAKLTKPASKTSTAKHTSLASLPMTRAEANAQAQGDDVVPVAQEAETIQPSPAAQPKAEPAPMAVAISRNATLEADLKPADGPKAAPSHAHGPAVPAVPPAATGITAAVASSAAVPADAVVKPSKAVKKHLVQSSAAAMTVEANPVDTGTRQPAVPALL